MLDLSKLSEAQLHVLMRKITPKLTKYIKNTPTPKQSAFLCLDCLEALYGGSAGGGKSDALLAAALQYVDEPDYAAILFRKSYADLSLPGSLMDRAREWLTPFVNTGEVRWQDKTKTYTFPSGATLTFGYLDTEADKYKYQGSEFQFVGFDELTQLSEPNYRYLFSRLRRLQGSKVPLRIRSASNPGGQGHTWVKNRFIAADKDPKRIFIPAGISDNPYLNADEYKKSLDNLDAVTREQLLRGDWDIKKQGALFMRTWFELVDNVPAAVKRIRYWDLAATKPNKNNPDPDWTFGILGFKKGPYVYIEDIIRMRGTPSEVENTIKTAALMDGPRTRIWIEQEPGSSGVMVIDGYVKLLKGFVVKGNKVTGSKILRAETASSYSERQLVRVKVGHYLGAFFDELELFPDGPHDDIVDSFSGIIEKCVGKLVGNAVPTAAGESDSYWTGT